MGDRENEAERFRASHGMNDNRNVVSDHPLVEVERIRAKTAELLADDNNQAFSQLFMGNKLIKNLLEDETESFALAYSFALHPLDDVEDELRDMGVTIKKTITETKLENGIEVNTQKEIDAPIRFEVTPIIDFIDEWMRKRVPANRLRVKELINAIHGQNENNQLVLRQPGMIPQEPMQRGRII